MRAAALLQRPSARPAFVDATALATQPRRAARNSHLRGGLRKKNAAAHRCELGWGTGGGTRYVTKSGPRALVTFVVGSGESEIASRCKSRSLSISLLNPRDEARHATHRSAGRPVARVRLAGLRARPVAGILRGLETLHWTFNDGSPSIIFFFECCQPILVGGGIWRLVEPRRVAFELQFRKLSFAEEVALEPANQIRAATGSMGCGEDGSIFSHIGTRTVGIDSEERLGIGLADDR